MKVNFHSVMRVILHRKIRPLWWRVGVLPRLVRITSAQFESGYPQATSADHLFATLQENAERTFFFGTRNRKDFFLHLLAQSQDLNSIITEGGAVLSNSIQLFGSGMVSLGEPIDWQKDFLSGHRWPLTRITPREILDLKRNSDIKVPWEVGRFHQVWWLGKAYWITGNEQYARKFETLVTEWIKANPPGMGVQWAIAMESAIRACNWICGFCLFSGSPALSQAFWEHFARALFAHGLFIWNNREASLRNGNHYLSNVVALLFLGLFFRQTSLGKRWMRWSIRELQNEMEYQVTPDGVSYEKSTSYHRLVLEFLTVAAVLCRLNAHELTPHFWSRLEKMFTFLAQYTRPDGSAPQLGDSDDGRLFRFRMSDPPNDHRHLLSVGAILFQRADFRTVAGSFSQDALFLLGPEGFEKFLQMPSQVRSDSSMRFPDGGFIVLRSPRVHIIADVGDIGMNGRGGHGHNDTLSFELWVHGQDFIVDRGTYTYTADPVARQDFRRTGAHNTVLVDSTEIAEFKDLWSVREDRTKPVVLECSLGTDRDLVIAEHGGYSRLPEPVVHRRQFDFHKSEQTLTITDELLGRGSHVVSLHFHIHPDIACLSESPSVWTLKGKEASLHVQLDAEAVREDSWYSPSYGIRVPMSVLVIRQTRELPAQFIATIRIVPHAS